MWPFKNEAGSAPVEFVLVVLPIFSVTLLTWSLITGGYLKLVLTDSVIEGARTAALADQGIREGKLRVVELTSKATMGLIQPLVSGNWQVDAFGNRIVSISASIQSPFRLGVTSSAFAETQG
mgnify:CR=1 FL=1